MNPDLYPTFSRPDQVHENLLRLTAKEADQWSRYSPYLEGVEGWKKTVISVILHNQSLVHSYLELNDYGKIFSLESVLEIIAKIWKESKLFDWVTVYPLLGPVGVVPVYNEQHLYVGSEVAAKTRNAKCQYSIDARNEDQALVWMKDILADELGLDIEDEVLEDLSNNVGVEGALDLTDIPPSEQSEAIALKMRDLGNQISLNLSEWYGDHKKRFPTWAIMNSDVHWLLKRDLNDDTTNDLMYPEVRVHVNPRFESEILMIWKGDDFQAGYQYCPYVALTPTVILKDDFGARRCGFFKRYGKRLAGPKARAYGKLKIILD